MSGPSKLRVEVLGDEIIVILPATSYGVSYCKPGDSPHLVAKNFVSKIDTGATITQAEFLAEAWQVANVQARDLGWIAWDGKAGLSEEEVGPDFYFGQFDARSSPRCVSAPT